MEKARFFADVTTRSRSGVTKTGGRCPVGASPCTREPFDIANRSLPQSVRPSRQRSDSAFARLRHGMSPVMERRALLVGLAGGLLAAPLAAEAQETGKVWRIGLLVGG